MVVYLETERVTLREFTLADEDNLFELDSDPEVMRYLTDGVPSSREQVRAGVARTLALTAKHHGRFGLWAALEKQSGAFMGWFHFRPSRSAPDDTKRIELGYRLKRAFWGAGYATEVSRALIEKGFRDLDVDEVFAITKKPNLASRRVMEKCGLSFVREYDDPDFGLTVELSLSKPDRR